LRLGVVFFEKKPGGSDIPKAMSSFGEERHRRDSTCSDVIRVFGKERRAQTYRCEMYTFDKKAEDVWVDEEERKRGRRSGFI
jgi:hypothetical protein